jgi:hypothetical protein
MFRSHLILIAMVAMASVPAGLAQDGEISINSKVGPEQIKERLESSDSVDGGRRYQAPAFTLCCLRPAATVGDPSRH